MSTTDPKIAIANPLERAIAQYAGSSRAPRVETVDGVDEAVRLVRNLIRTGRLENGTAVSAGKLADALKLHRNTAGKALNTLAREGYLRRRQGRPPCVVSSGVRLPDRRTPMISHTQVAHDNHLEIASEILEAAITLIEEIPNPSRRERLERHLGPEPGTEIFTLSRIRKIRRDDTGWTPALAELAYFVAPRLPALALDDLQAGRVESIRDFLRDNGFEVINSEYRIRISGLPKPFWRTWARAAGIDEEAVAALRFLRLESVTHSQMGPIEYSIAYLKEGLYAFTTTDVSLSVELRAEDLVPRNGATPAARPARHASTFRNGMPGRTARSRSRV